MLIVGFMLLEKRAFRTMQQSNSFVLERYKKNEMHTLWMVEIFYAY